MEVESSLVDATGTLIKRVVAMVHLDAGQSKTVNQKIEVRQPHLWSPDSPYLYRVESRVKEGKNTLDGGITRAGIRKAEFKGKEGFWLNGKPFGQLIGANRHQDFAYVGNALPNSGQWRDAKKLRDAGLSVSHIIRKTLHLWMHAMNWECLLSLRHRVGNIGIRNRSLPVWYMRIPGR